MIKVEKTLYARDSYVKTIKVFGVVIYTYTKKEKLGLDIN